MLSAYTMRCMRRLLVLLAVALPLSAALRQPVTVVRDRWGVPHIYASNQHDLFYAQGFVQAQDRLYQMEIWKRAGQGRLAEIFGSPFVGRDIAARKLRYRGSMIDEYASYAPDAREILLAFTEGINEFIDARRDRLPAEFAMAGFKPEHWKPEDCLQRLAAYGLMSNAASELRHARIVATLGVEKNTSMISPLPPADIDPVTALDYAALDPDMLRDFVSSDMRIEVPPPGSNNWVLAGSKTASGKPLLANDPHRTLSIPSLRYVVHLVAPGWNVIGAVEPALPGVAIGHNEDIAWGITVFGADQQDLYVETLRDGKYKTESGWRPLRVEHETIDVKGGVTVPATIEFTRHGPVIWKKGDRAVALRWVGAQPGTAGYLGSLALDRAHNWIEFQRAMRRWKVPGENIVYADRSGHIGEQSTALTPRRSWTGLLPVDGSSGNYEWTGFIPIDELPHSYDPTKGFIATANNLTLSKDDRRHIAHEWASDFRIDRIEEVLSGPAKLGTSDMAALQNDVTSLAARSWLEILRQSGLQDDAAKMLLEWEGRISTDSAAAALYEVWMRELRPAYARRVAPAVLADVAEQVLGSAGTLNGVQRMADGERRELVSVTLTRALAATRKLLGDDPARWRWGTLHAARFRHGLDKRADDLSRFDPPAVERPGDGDTVNATGWRTPYTQAHGATFREVIDLGSWDRSLVINTPGQSGEPGSPHYADLLPLWARGEYFPLVYSREAVDANAEATVVMRPAGEKTMRLPAAGR
ncbi:MAG: penicillin acylase family protein [Thermoanaerobaculia bacterium]